MLNDQIVGVTRIRSVVDDCSDLMDELELALDRAEAILPVSVLEGTAERIAALATRHA